MTKKKKTVTYETTYDYDCEDFPHFDESSALEEQTYYQWPPKEDDIDPTVLAKKRAQSLTKNGETLTPVKSSKRKICSSFWGLAWCQNLQNYEDYDYRLCRGRSYLKKGLVIDLKVASELITARVSGSELYQVEIKIKKLSEQRWQNFTSRFSHSLDSTLALLSGKLPEDILSQITDPKSGLFPRPEEISFNCECLDWADMCKHVAATLYGVGVRLDQAPEFFFTLRGIDPGELIKKSGETLARAFDVSALNFDKNELEQIFGIDINV